jgi:hypothetical protein
MEPEHDWREAALEAHLARHGWPASGHAAAAEPLAPDRTVLGPAGARACAWFRRAADAVELRTYLLNKAEALLHRFYGPTPKSRTTFMSNGYPVVAHYAEWCARSGLGFDLQTGAKAKAFLEERLERSREMWAKRDADGHAGNSNSPADAAYNAYRHSVCHLTAVSFWQGYDVDLVATEEVQTLRIALLQAVKRAKTRVQDSAATSALLTKRLDVDETARLFRQLWAGALEGSYKTPGGRERAQMRGLLVAALNQAAGRRGGDMRGMDLRMLLFHALEDVKPAPAWTLGVSLRTVKEDNLLEDREHLLGFMRARDRWRCPVGALAAHLEFMDRSIAVLKTMRRDLAAPRRHERAAPPEWWTLPLLPGRRADRAISATTHTSLTHAGFEAADIRGKRAVTHLHRPTALANMLEGGVVSTDACLYQGWAHGVWADTYAKCCFKVLPMLKAHGWDARLDGYECWWEGADADVPDALKALVFPGLDDVDALARARWARHRDDRSAVEVCRVLKSLRRVFLEDAIVKQPEFPDFPAYRDHPVFRSPAWPAYAVQEAARARRREREWQLRRHDSGLADALAEQRELLQALQPSQKQVAAVAEPQPLAGGLPELPEPHVSDLAITYARWCDGPRAAYAAYLSENRRIAWAKAFPRERANAAKVRYYKMKPFLEYLDADEDAAPRALEVLAQLMRAHRVDGPVFVKQCFYALSVNKAGAADAPKLPPPIPPAALARALLDAGLPLPARV